MVLPLTSGKLCGFAAPLGSFASRDLGCGLGADNFLCDTSSRGTLIPLYPSLSSQLAAIARAYGLPSTGGIVLYLVETTDPWSANSAPLPGSAGLAGGPRIGDDAWSLLWERLFAVEGDDDLELLSEDDAFAPPVPPIPHTHQNRHDGSPTARSNQFVVDSQQRRPLVKKLLDPEGGSDGTEGDLERLSSSSEAAGADGEDLHNTHESRIEGAAQQGSAGKAPHGPRSPIGRGLPSSLPSPGGSSSRNHSYTSGRLSSFSSHQQRQHSSRLSMRSSTSRLPNSGRATSFSSYSAASSLASAYGSAVVVGKIEFDIDRRRGKWYDAWLESANTANVNGGFASGLSSAAPSPLTSSMSRQASAGREQMLAPIAAPQPRQPIDATQQTDTTPAPEAPSHFLSEQSRGLRPLELSRSTSPVSAVVDKHEELTSPRSIISAAASGYSNAAMIGHGSDVDEMQPALSPSIAAVSTRSRSSSGASSVKGSAIDNDEHAYQPLTDGEEHDSHLKEDDDRSTRVKSMSTASIASDAMQYGERTGHIPESLAPTQLSPAIAMHQLERDPLADVFPDDESTWRSLAASDAEATDERNPIEITGLGIIGASALAHSAPEGVLERRPEEIIQEEHQLPPENDVADVVSMLQSGQSADKRDEINLASPIHLDSSPSAPSSTGVFESVPQFPDEGEREQVQDASRSTPAQTNFEHDSRYGSMSPGQGFTSVSIDVRPPSTVHSSPEFVPERKQRNGWAAVPPVVERSMSASTSLASMTTFDDNDSQRSSTTGLMENLDDLERALADLTPVATKTSPILAMADASGLDLREALRPPATEEPSTRVSVDRQMDTDAVEVLQEPMPQSASPATAISPLPSPRLNSRPMFRYGSSTTAVPTTATSTPLELPIAPARKESLTAQIIGNSLAGPEEGSAPRLSSTTNDSEFPPLQQESLAPAERTDAAASILQGDSLDVDRAPPRSSSLTRTSPQVEPQQLPLPPSPMPNRLERAVQGSSASASVDPMPVSSSAPAPPHHYPEQHIAVPLPPASSGFMNEELQTVPQTQTRSPKSPGGFKGLRANKSWRKGKSKEAVDSTDASLDSQPESIVPASLPFPPPPTPGTSEVESAPKSPRTGLFGKPAFAKIGGMFQKKSTAEGEFGPPGRASLK